MEIQTAGDCVHGVAQCAECGKTFPAEQMMWFNAAGVHVCDDCLWAISEWADGCAETKRECPDSAKDPTPEFSAYWE